MSSPPRASRLPSGLNAAALTRVACARRTDSLVSPFLPADQRKAAPCTVPVSLAPSRLNARASTWIGWAGTSVRALAVSGSRHSHRHIGPFSELPDPVTRYLPV